MTIVYSSRHYDIIILDPEIQEKKDVNYGIMNREYGVIESMCSALFMAYELVKDLEKRLEESKPKATLKVVE